MPGSMVNGKDDIKEWFGKQTDIYTIVDVGPGQGTYPQLLGNKYEWIGIEIWAPYIAQFDLMKLYKEVRVGDIRFMKLPEADCIIFGDVLEHLEHDEAMAVMLEALEKYPHMVISIPCSELGELQYGKEHYGNWFENHKSGWKISELEALTKWEKVIHSKSIGIYIR